MMKNGRMSFDSCSLAHVDDDRALVRLVDRSRAYRSQPGARRDVTLSGRLTMTDNVNGTIDLDGKPFRHRMIPAADMRFHLVEGGTGPIVILMAGFPQSWYAWRRVMPKLLDRKVRGVELTAAGRIFLDHARLVLLQLDNARDAVRRVTRPDKNSFVLGFLT